VVCKGTVLGEYDAGTILFAASVTSLTVPFPR
jgi:hypothetical protein